MFSAATPTTRTGCALTVVRTRQLARARHPFTYSAAAACCVWLNPPPHSLSPSNPDVTRLISASGVISFPSAADTRLIEAANWDVTNHNITSGNKIVLIVEKKKEDGGCKG